jgi:serine/threonine-protein kinase
VLRALAGGAPSPSPKQRRPGIPPELAAICEKAMSKSPQARFLDAGAMAAELRAFRDGRLVSIYAYSRRELLRRFVARNRVAVIAAAGVFLATLAGGGLALRYAVVAERARAQAELALEEVTELGELAQVHARKGSAAVDGHLQSLQADLQAIARDFHGEPAAALRKAYADLGARTAALAGLFWVDPSGAIRAAEPRDVVPSTGARVGERPSTEWIDPMQDRSLSGGFREGPRASWVGVQVPLVLDGRRSGVLAALLRADRLIAAVVPPAAPVRGRKPDVWAMQRDGLVLYDEDPDYVGTDLFRDQVNTVLPGVVEFGRRMQQEDSGVSHYAYFSADGLGREHYVAAWHTLTLPSGVQWQLVVDYPYVVVRQ